MFAEYFHWASSQTQPVLTMGDFNETPDTSPVHSLCSQWGLWIVGPQWFGALPALEPQKFGNFG